MPALPARLPLLLTLALALAGCHRGDDAAKKPRPPPLVQVQKVIARDVPVEVRAPVDLRPMLSADVGSKTLGYLSAVLVDRGDRVKRGQLLAVVRPSDLPDQLTAARSTIAQVQAQSALARTNLERARSLAPQGVVSQQELQQAQSQFQASQAALSAAQAQVGAVSTRIGETKIESPIDGVIAERRLDPGALVGGQGGNNVILTVARTDVLRVFISVNERDAQGLTLDKQARVELDAMPGHPYAGQVVRLAPEFDPVTRTLQAEVQIPNPDFTLRPGMYGQGFITIETHPQRAVAPIEAVQISEDAAYAFVVEGDVVHRRKLKLGIDGGDWMEILEGLKPGEEVVVAGIESLAEGAKVRVARAPPGSSGSTGGAALPAAR
jgi:RND family efflux transporter MFP subunit